MNRRQLMMGVAALGAASADGLKPAKLTLAVTAAEAPKYQATVAMPVKA